MKRIVPEVCVGEVLDGGVGGEFACAVGFDDFAAALPVVYSEGGTMGVPPPYGGGVPPGAED